MARRQEHFSLRAETELDFSPDTFQQAAGLTHYYNRHKFHFLAVSFDERLGPRAHHHVLSRRLAGRRS